MSGTRIASSLYLAMNLTERLVMSYRFKPLDVCIVRPSLILGAAKSPSPGFIGAPTAEALTQCSVACDGIPSRPVRRQAKTSSCQRINPQPSNI